MTEFAAIMNDRAKEIGVKNSNFVNPHGYHNENHYTTAYDLALITREAFKILYLEIVKQPSANIGSESSPNQQKLSFRNRNLLLDSRNSNTYYPYATGVKTGFTDEAGNVWLPQPQKTTEFDCSIKLPVDARWNGCKDLI